MDLYYNVTEIGSKYQLFTFTLHFTFLIVAL